jgi:hypothetical protein
MTVCYLTRPDSKISMLELYCIFYVSKGKWQIVSFFYFSQPFLPEGEGRKTPTWPFLLSQPRTMLSVKFHNRHLIKI